ncbi:MAG: hypothetical protein GWP61_00295 [Chloroflexi bacterium]|jgi:hypothetical protein|nr:hypothetical protein [Chloroflexota bacterium]
MRSMVKLQVYVREDCWTCAESQRIVSEIAPQFPQIAVELLDLESTNQPENIFAVPTYVLDGRVIFLGNPYREQLRQEIQDALSREQM